VDNYRGEQLRALRAARRLAAHVDASLAQRTSEAAAALRLAAD
jgi:hypothetical protein